MNKTTITFLLACSLGAAAHDNEVHLTTNETHRVMESNGIPEHSTGQFPNRRNPNSISPQNHTFNIPLKPTPLSEPREVGLNTFGVGINGVPFDPNAAEWYNNDRNSGWNLDALPANLGFDQHDAHVQPTGSYHYHGVPNGLIRNAGGNNALLGWAADGYPIYYGKGYDSSYQLKKGKRPDEDGPGGRYDGTYVEDYEYVEGSGGLDACNGRFVRTKEYPEGTYAYFITDEFPVVPRFWKGEPDRSFLRRGGGGRGGRDGRRAPRGEGRRDGYGPPPHHRDGHRPPHHRRPPPPRY